jgi:hypothetical protein
MNRAFISHSIWQAAMKQRSNVSGKEIPRYLQQHQRSTVRTAYFEESHAAESRQMVMTAEKAIGMIKR